MCERSEMLPQSSLLKYTQPGNGLAMRNVQAYNNASNWNRDVASHFLKVKDSPNYPYFLQQGIGNQPRTYVVRPPTSCNVAAVPRNSIPNEMQPFSDSYPQIPPARYPLPDSGNAFFVQPQYGYQQQQQRGAAAAAEYMNMPQSMPRYPARTNFMPPIDPSVLPAGGLDIPHQVGAVASALNRSQQYPAELMSPMAASTSSAIYGDPRRDMILYIVLGIAIVEAIFIMSLLHTLRK